jgi:periplasmic protein TonB
MRAASPTHQDGAEARWRLIRRWAAATACVAAAHGGIAWAVVNWPRPEIAAGEPPSAIMIEFAPVPLAPQTPPQDVAVGPEMTLAKQSSPSELSEDKPEEVEPQKVIKAELVEEPPEQVIDTDVEIPELPVVENAEAVLAQPPKQIEVVEAVEAETPPQPKRKPEPKASKASKQQDTAKTSSPTTSAPKPLKVRRSRTNAAPSPGVSSTMSVATWRGRVMAHLNRRKRHPGGSARGTSSVAFVIDRSGRVLSARLIRSSGNGALDRAAVALARRASPVPAPPANVGRRRITLTVPIHFSR